MPVTLKDIADATGYSISTVSRTINGNSEKRPSEETRRKIWAAVKQLGYKPNKTAQSLVLGTEVNEYNENGLGIILSSEKGSFENHFFGEIFNYLLNNIQQSGYSLSYSLSIFSMSQAEFYNKITSIPVKGAILLGQFEADTFQYIRSVIPNLVYTGVNSIGRNTDEVICDGYKCAEEAVNFLIKNNYKKIGYIGKIPKNNSHSLNAYIRYNSYVDTLNKHKININYKYIKEASYDMESGYQAMKELLSSSSIPETVFCEADVIAIGATKAAYDCGFRIPDDIGLIAIDDIAVSAYLCPSLTTVHVPKNSLSRLSVNMLIDKINNNRSSNVRLDVPYELVVRNSCKILNKYS